MLNLLQVLSRLQETWISGTKLKTMIAGKEQNCYHVLVKLAYKSLENTEMLGTKRVPNGNKLSIDFDKVAVREEVSDTDEANEEFLFHETYVSQMSDEVHDAMLRELKSWKSQHVYEEVHNKH